MKYKRVYVAGAYNADNVITVLDNMRKGMRVATVLLQNGLSPFCPWLDYHFQLMLRDGESLSIDDYYRYSIDWLDVSDCMLVIPGYENSKGTLKEVEFAERKGIPVYYDLEKFLDEV